MVIWQIKGDKIDGTNDIAFYELQGDARKKLREYRKKHGKSAGEGPTKVVVRGRETLVLLLREAMLGSGMNTGVAASSDDQLDEDTFI